MRKRKTYEGEIKLHTVNKKTVGIGNFFVLNNIAGGAYKPG